MSFFIFKNREMDGREFPCRQEESRQANQPVKFARQDYRIGQLACQKPTVKATPIFTIRSCLVQKSFF
jgi:hypothetical protein